MGAGASVPADVVGGELDLTIVAAKDLLGVVRDVHLVLPHSNLSTPNPHQP